MKLDTKIAIGLVAWPTITGTGLLYYYQGWEPIIIIAQIILGVCAIISFMLGFIILIGAFED